MKRPQKQKSAVLSEPKDRTLLWIGVAALAALFAVFEVYAPALNGGFILDDRYLPVFDPNITGEFSRWVGFIRPMLGFSYWLDYIAGHGADASGFRTTNIAIHFVASMLAAAVAWKLLEWAGVERRLRIILTAFAGAIFLLHPLQTESVSYVASRSESLAGMFYLASFAVFLYRPGDTMSIPRTLAVVALFGAAALTKEHTLTLPVLLILTDWFWRRGGLRAHRFLYGLLVLSGIAGGAFVYRVLSGSNTAGFRMADLPPVDYFFTQCRVIWTYIRMFFLPYGQNIDPDIPISHGILDHGAIFGLIGFIIVLALAWIYRHRYPLAAFGVIFFFLLIAPTSSIVPIHDVLAERRVYLPLFGLILVVLEFLRPIKRTQAITIGIALVLACFVLTYQRNTLWQTPLALWRDSVAKSPQKYRPRFQLAYAQYETGSCAESARSYQVASTLGTVDHRLLVDWALAQDCAGDWAQAIETLRHAQTYENTSHVHSQIAMVLAKHGHNVEALDELAEAERLDPSNEMIYLYRGNISETAGDRASALREYRKAAALNPQNQAVREALARVSR